MKRQEIATLLESNYKRRILIEISISVAPRNWAEKNPRVFFTYAQNKCRWPRR